MRGVRIPLPSKIGKVIPDYRRKVEKEIHLREIKESKKHVVAWSHPSLGGKRYLNRYVKCE